MLCACAFLRAGMSAVHQLTENDTVYCNCIELHCIRVTMLVWRNLQLHELKSPVHLRTTARPGQKTSQPVASVSPGVSECDLSVSCECAVLKVLLQHHAWLLK